MSLAEPPLVVVGRSAIPQGCQVIGAPLAFGWGREVIDKIGVWGAMTTGLRSLVTLVAGMLMLAGCAGFQQETVYIDTTISDEALKPYRTTGPASISGQGFLRQQGGGVVTCAGSAVLLAPDLPPVRRAVEEGRKGKRIVRQGPKWQDVARKTTCDAQGNFVFENLPLESWFLATEVKWVVAYEPQGGTVGRFVSTRDGGQQRVLLSDDDLIAW